MNITTDVFQVVNNFIIDTQALQIWILKVKHYSHGLETLISWQLLHQKISNYLDFVMISDQ